MSAHKKVLSALVVIIFLVAGFVFFNNYQQDLRLKNALQENNRIEALYHLTEYEKYAQAIRQEGYTVIPNSPFQLDKSGYSLGIKGKLHLKVSYISEQSDEFSLYFSTEVNGQELTATLWISS